MQATINTFLNTIINTLTNLPFLPSCSALLLLIGFIMLTFGLTLEIGTTLLHSWIEDNNPHRKTIFGIINKIASLNQILLLLLIIMFMTMFPQSCSALVYLFYPFMTLLAFTFTIRTLIIKSKNIKLGKFNEMTHKIMQWTLTDTALVLVFVMSATFAGLLNGLPFYLDNHNKIISLFDIESCFNIQTFHIATIFLVTAITQSSIVCYIKTGLVKMKTIASVSSIILLTLISLTIIPLHMIKSPFLCTYFPTQFIIICYILLPIQAMALNICLFFANNKKMTYLALLFSCSIIKIFILLFAMILFPHFIPSSIDQSQHLGIFNSFSDINTLATIIPWLVAFLALAYTCILIMHKKILK